MGAIVEMNFQEIKVHDSKLTNRFASTHQLICVATNTPYTVEAVA